MKPTAENLRRELLPGIDMATATLLEDSIKEFISTRELPLYRMMSFQFGWVDENGERSNIPTRPRLHGQFALSVAAALSAESQKATVPFVVPLELMHNTSLIHEDVEDGNTEHNGRPSVWWTWGPAQAINAGDGMHAMARMAMFALTDRGEPVEKVSGALRSLDRAAVLMFEGEYNDIAMQEQIALSVDKYLEMVCARSGALFGAAGQIAAISTGKPELAETLFEFGQLAGAARQAAADYMLFWGGEDLDPVQHGRLLTKKKNLPVVHTFETATPTIKRQLGDIYVQRVIDPVKAGEITNLLEEAGSREFTLETVAGLLTKASDTLDTVDISPETKQCLEDLVKGLTGVE